IFHDPNLGKLLHRKMLFWRSEELLNFGHESSVSCGPERCGVSPNVFPVVHPLKTNERGSLINGREGVFQCRACSRHTKYSTAARDQLALGESRSSVQGLHTSN